MLEARPRARSMLFDLYGDFADEGGRPGAIRLSAVVRLAADLGVSETAVRSAASRLVQDGWLTAARRGRERIYALSAQGRQLVTEGRRRIFSPPNSTWDGRFCVVALSVPEARREVRDRMRKELSWLGFGSPSSALYVHPHDHRQEVLHLARELDAADYLQVYRAEAHWPADAHELVTRTWENLAELNGRYRQFVTAFAPGLQRARAQARSGKLERRRAFRTRFMLVNQFRKCLFGDPDLPEELLPSGWKGGTARRLFLEYHDLVSPPALAYFDAICLAPL